VIASSYAIDSRLPINRLKRSATKTKIALNPKAPAAAVPRFEEVTLPDSSSSSSTGPSVIVDGTGSSSSSTGRIKGTPGAPCDTYTLCSECTDDGSKAFYCMWSAARNVCQEDTDMDKLKRENPGDLWTKQCEPKVPEPITDCQGCPISPLDKKPARDIIDSQIKGSDGQYALATEGSLHRIGVDPNDPITGAITNPNGTFAPIFILPSIRDADGNIKDPVQDLEKLTHSPCVDPNCPGAFQFKSKRKGKFAPVAVGSDADKPEQDSDETSVGPRMKHVPHVDKVGMQDAVEEGRDVEVIEIASSTKKDSAGFTPTFSDDDSSQSSNSLQPSREQQPQQDHSTDAPRFTQSKRSSSQSMSTAKTGTNSIESTMEVTEFDENVTGGKKNQ